MACCHKRFGKRFSQPPRHRGLVSSRIPSPVGASLLAMKSPQFQSRTPHPHHQKTFLLQPPPTPLYQATHPCAFAYNYARIRPLVRLVPGFYCLPATAHQWSGLVARFTSRCTSLISQALPVLDGGCAHGTLGCAGFDVITGLLTCAQPPPFRLVARGLRPN
jgi:hypothetical protein